MGRGYYSEHPALRPAGQPSVVQIRSRRFCVRAAVRVEWRKGRRCWWKKYCRPTAINMQSQATRDVRFALPKHLPNNNRHRSILPLEYRRQVLDRDRHASSCAPLAASRYSDGPTAFAAVLSRLEGGQRQQCKRSAGPTGCASRSSSSLQTPALTAISTGLLFAAADATKIAALAHALSHSTRIDHAVLSPGHTFPRTAFILLRLALGTLPLNMPAGILGNRARRQDRDQSQPERHSSDYVQSRH